MRHLPHENPIALQAYDEQSFVYEAPAIIYEEVISARAGSPLGFPEGRHGVDPADLFGE